QLAAALGDGAPRGDAAAGASNSQALDQMAEGAPPRMNGDGNNIEDLVVKWITPDDFEDGENEPLLSTRPGGTGRSDARQSIIAQIDYSVSGEHDYEEGDIRIMVPATMFRLRNGRQAGNVVIPLAEAPSKSTDFNWQLISDAGGDYYVFTNTRAMSAATKGFIQVEWNNLTPHEIADAYRSIYTDNKASQYADDGPDGITGQNKTAPWYAYMEVTTFRDNTLRARSNQINALMDTSEVVDAAYKRHTTSSPTVVSRDELPADRIPAVYDGEEDFVIVDWYTYAHYKGNQPFTLDIKDELDLEADRLSGVTMDGFVYGISVNGTPAYDGAAVEATGIYSGWPSQEKGDTAYVHIYSAYPASQFEPEPKSYIFHNKVTYTLHPIDGVDDYTVATATDSVSYSWHPSEWKDTTGHFMVFKWGNDGERELENYAERDMVAHRPGRESETISRMGTQQHYSTWYGIYDDAINKLRDGETTRLWYTIKSEGWVVPWTLQRPTDETGVRPDSDLVNGWWQWAKWNGEAGRYEVAETVEPGWKDHATYDSETNTYKTDKSKTDGYELIPYTRIESNYLRRPVTMVTTDQGLHLEGSTSTDDVTYDQSVSGGYDLTPGSDYTFDYVEVQKPRIGKLVGINVNLDGSFSVKNNQDGTFEYDEDNADSKIPPIIFQVEVDGTWQQQGNTGDEFFAKVDWSSGSPVTTYADGHAENSAVVKMPENTTNFRTVATTTQNAYLMEYLYPGVTLTPEGQANLKEFCANKFKNAEGGTVYRPSTWVYNGVHMDAYQYDNAGTVMDEEHPLFQRTKWGEDRLNGYTEDLKVTPKKSAEFDHMDDVDYEKRLATVHYKAEVRESTFISDRATYDAALEDESVPQLRPETSGIWYDLLPEGMTPDVNSVKLRDGDSVKRAYAEKNWRGTGRTMLVVEADLTPAPRQYKETTTSAVQFWEDVPSITFDAVMDLDTWVDLGGNPADAQTGITSHNVVAFESSKDTLGNVRDYSGEYNEPNPVDGYENIATKTACKDDTEVTALTGLDSGRTTPSFVYAGVDTRLAFPTAARTSLSKNIMVNDDGRWSQGTYDDVRTVWEGGFYSYRLRMMSDANTKSKDLVLYDSLENYYAVDGNDDADIDAPRWRGEFVSVDLEQIRKAGCDPVLYYSTEQDLHLSDDNNARRSNADNIDINNGDIWVPADEYQGDLKDVHAIAIDCSKNKNKEDFILQPGTTITAYVRMHAPWGTDTWDTYEKVTKYYDGGGSARDYIAADAHAYNNVYLVSRSVNAQDDFDDTAESTLDFIRFDYTKVGIKEYNVPVNKVWNDDDDRDGRRTESVKVTLLANGEPAGTQVVGDNGNTRILNDDNEWTDVFNNLPYTDSQGQKITYRVVELPEDVPAGYKAVVSGTADDGFTITNRHTPERTSVIGTKTWVGDEDDPTTRPAYIDVQLYANGELLKTKRIEPREEVVQEAVGTEGDEGYQPAVTQLVWPTYTFADLYKYEDGKEIDYTVQEYVPGGAYVSAVDSTDITNTYHPYGDVSITKKVAGATAVEAGKKYKFDVILDTPLGNDQYEPLTGSYDWESSTGATGTVKSGGSLELVADETVTIKELPHNTRVTFTEHEYEGFTTAGGNIKASTVRQNATRTVNVNNTYAAKGSATLVAEKALKGAKLKNNKFAFQLLDESGKQVRTAANRADGSVTFGALNFTVADLGEDGKAELRYTIKEIVPEGAEEVEGGYVYKGYTYDLTEYGATVTLEDKGDGTIESTVVYGEDEVKFNNTYHAEGKTSLTAWKALDTGGLDRELAEGEFEFKLEAVRGEDAEGNAIAADKVPMPTNATAKNDDKGVIHFDEIDYTEADAGNTYYYMASEVPGDDDAVVYSDAKFAYKVTVVDNGDGTLSVAQGNAQVVTVDDGPLCLANANSAERAAYNWYEYAFANYIYMYTDDNFDDIVASKQAAAQWLSAAFELDITADGIKQAYKSTDGYYYICPVASVAEQLGIAAPNSAYINFRKKSYPDFVTHQNKIFATNVRTEHIEVTPEAADQLPVFVNKLKPGSLAIEKRIQGENDDPSQEFTFHVKLTGDNIVPDAAYTYDLEQIQTTKRTTAQSAGGKAVSKINNPIDLLIGLFTPTTAYAATGEVIHQGTLNNGMGGVDNDVSWKLYSDGTLVIEPIDGESGIWYEGSPTAQAWMEYKDQITAVETHGSINLRYSAMAQMFKGLDKLKTADVGAFVIDEESSWPANGCSSMFEGCSSLRTVTGLDKWVLTPKFKNLSSMFRDCSSLESIDFTNWDTSNVTNMASMFSGCSSLTELDVSGFNTDNVTDMSNMFYGCSKLDTIDVSNFNTENVTNMGAMFYNCKAVQELDVSGFVTSQVTQMSSMFSGCEKLTELDVSGFVTSNVTSMSAMFSNCKSLETIDVSKFDTSKVTSLGSVFYECRKLKEVDVSKWKTGECTSLYDTFAGCEALEVADVSGWDTSKVTNMKETFNGCKSLEVIDVSGWVTDNVTTMYWMFQHCEAVKVLDVDEWNTSNVTEMYMMFQSCKSLIELDAGSWDTSKVKNFYWMFTNCPELTKLDMSNWTMNKEIMTMPGDTIHIGYDNKLQEVKIGPGFSFGTNPSDRFCTPSSPFYSGRWIRVDADGNMIGEAYTPQDHYAAVMEDAASMAGTWVWEPQTIVIHFDANGGEGAMDDYIVSESPFTIPSLGYSNPLAEFVAWTYKPNEDYYLFDNDVHTQARLYNSGSSLMLGNVVDWPVSPGHPAQRGISMLKTDAGYERTLYAIWQYKDYIINYELSEDDSNAGASGSMASETVPLDQDHKLANPTFYWFKHQIVGWDANGDGEKDYDLGQTIPANTYTASTTRKVLNLTALWGDVDTTAQSENGEFTIKLHGGERAVFTDQIPAGASYEVWEETPDGWKLVQTSGTTGTIKPTETSTASFTNKKDESELKGTAKLEATKLLKTYKDGEEVTGDEARSLEADEFSFRLYEGEGTDGTLLQTATNNGEGKVEFRELALTEAKTYTYTIQEVAGTEDGMTYASDPVTATVVAEEATDDDGKPYLKTTVSYDPEDKTFTNTFEEVQPTTYTLSVQKVVEGKPEGASPKFSFDVALTNELGQPLSAEETEAVEVVFDNDGTKTVSAGKISLKDVDPGFVKLNNLPEGTRYQVTETSIPAGWALKSEGENASGEMDESKTTTFTNEYTSHGLVSLKAYKAFDGGEIEEGQFTFGLYDNEACEGDPIRVQSNGPATNGRAEVAFGPITLEKADTYTYYIKEVAGADETVEYSHDVITATVEARDLGNGTLESTVTYDPKADTITNTKKPGWLNIHKTLANPGGDVADAEFPVTVTLTDASGEALEGEFVWTSDRDGVEGGTVRSGGELMIHADETITIKDLPDGTRYALSEGETAGFAQVEEASENVEGAIASNQASEASFTNRRDTATTIALQARKVLKGGTLEAGEFTFQLLDAAGKVVDEVTNGADGKVTFKDLSFAYSDLDKSPFTYQIKEVAGDKDYITYASDVYAATVTLAEDDGELIATAAYQKNDEDVDGATFTNTYQASGEHTIEVKKELVGKDLASEEFAFVLARPNGAPLSAADARTQLSATNGADGKVAFEAIKYDQRDIGKTYTYIVTETDTGESQIVYDEHAYSVKVTITDGGEGKVVATEQPVGEGRDVFKNAFVTEGSADINVRKIIDGRDWLDDDEFTFTLAADRYNPDATAVPESTTLMLTKANSGENHTASFGTIAFKKPGGYRYTITETPGSANHMTYDSTTRTVDVIVTEDKEEGKLLATVDYGEPNVAAAVFTNKYAPDTPGFEKKVMDANDSGNAAGHDGVWQDSADYDIGDAVPFQLKATLPDDVSSYKKYHLTFTDKMESTLAFDEFTAVKVGDETYSLYGMSDGDKRKMETDGGLEVIGAPGRLGARLVLKKTSDQSFTVRLDWEGADGATIPESVNGKVVEVLFNATLTEAANIGKAGNVNAAMLSYSNNPGVDEQGQPSEDEGTKPWDYVIVFTYKVDVSKVDDTAAAAALKGAKFRLYKKYAPVPRGMQADADGFVAVGDEQGAANGSTFAWKGLDDGTYKLVETEAPKGYKAIDPVTFVVSAEHVATWDYTSIGTSPAYSPASPARTTILGTLAPAGSDAATGAISLGSFEGVNFAGGTNKVTDVKLGALEIRKGVTVNNAHVEGEESAVVNGDYAFQVFKAKEDGTKGDKVRDVTITIADGKSTTARVEDLEAGDYIVSEVAPGNGTFLNGPNDIKVTVKEGSDAEAETVRFTNNKPGTPDFEKKVQDVNDTTGKTSIWQDSADYDIGDKVPYRLAATLPHDVSNYKRYHLTFTDKMESSLDFNEVTSVKIVTKDESGNDVETPVAKENYKLTEDEKDPNEKVHGFALTLRWGDGSDVVADTTEGLDDATVVVEFNAILNESAELGKEGNVNAAKLSYSNTPNSTDDHEEDSTEWDYVIAFTYRLDVNKLDKDTQVALEGAEFKLEKRLADDKLKEVALEVDGNTFTAKGLDDGTYILTETKVPFGYKKADPIEFTVAAEHNGEWDVHNGNGTIPDSRAGVLTSLTGSTQDGQLTFAKAESKDEEAILGDVVDQGLGALIIRKNVTSTSGNKADGTYHFTLKDAEGKAVTKNGKGEAIDEDITLTIEGGKSSSVVIRDLLPGTYTVVEDTNRNPDGIYLLGQKSHELEVKVRNDFDAEGNEDLANVPTADFTNTKPDKPDFEKKIMDVNDSTGDGSDWQDSADYDIGDAVPFRLAATLPTDFSDYPHYHLTFKDMMDPSLDFAGITKVTIDGKEIPAENYQLDANEDGHRFDLTVAWGTKKDAEGKATDEPNAISADLNGKDVVVEFEATLNKKAVLGADGNVNGAQLVYSNSPSVDDEDKTEDSTEWDYVIAFTYQLNVSKVTPELAALEGAEFKLEKRLADGSLKEVALEVDANVFSGVGVDDGTYVLTETKAPKGYKAIDPVTFTIDAKHAAEWDARNDLGEAPDTRSKVLTDLTGDAENGAITIKGDEDQLAYLTTDVIDLELRDLALTKRLDRTVAEDADALATEFSFTVALTNLPAWFVDPEASSVEVATDDGTATFQKAEDGTWTTNATLKANETVTYVGLPKGAKYTVTEAADPNYGVVKVAVDGEDATAVKNGAASSTTTGTLDGEDATAPATVEYTNASVSSLMVAKANDFGSANLTEAQKRAILHSITFTVTGPDGFSESRRMDEGDYFVREEGTDNYVWTLVGLAPGDYTVSETRDEVGEGGLGNRAKFGGEPGSAHTYTLDGGAPVRVDVANSFASVEREAKFSVTKVITGDADAYTK
ncbi:MAG: BspA family leucine-rich repeat surface protein, partial [Atopobiaceae bacterium]|nr:BspA family leucine-rich repeat surface protein [Atopobiaceae bacterium]